MPFSEYASYDGLGLAGLLARGDVSAAEVVEAAIARIEKHNPTLNAVIFKMYDQAREVAARSPRPVGAGALRGVPILLKDLLGDYQGVPTTNASRFLAGRPAPRDSELVARYKRAGLIAVGKSNACEFGLLPITEPQRYGPCRNPWNTDRSTGGSSGGSAAAVAAGIVPIAHANDGGGSIRIPASCCGLVGMKPTRARNPLGPIVGDVMSGLVAEHVVTRSVRDSAAVLDCTAGPAVGDPYWAPPPQRSFLEEVSRDPGRLRIAFWTRTLQGESVHRECVAAVERTAQVCSKLGHEVEEACPQLIDPEPLARAFLTIWAAGCTVAIDVAGLASGRQPRAEHFEPLTWALYEQGKEVSAARYQMSVGLLQLAARQLGTFLERYAVWLTPTLGQPPVKLGTIDTSESDAEKAFAPIFGYLPFTWLFNGSGQPALSLPLHWSVDGLPIGVHFAGRFGDEGLLYRLAGQLEQAVPWRDRKPPIWD